MERDHGWNLIHNSPKEIQNIGINLPNTVKNFSNENDTVAERYGGKTLENRYSMLNISSACINFVIKNKVNVFINRDTI